MSATVLEPVDNVDVGKLCAEIIQAARAAGRSVEPDDRDFLFGPARIRQRFLGPALVARMTDAIRHAEVPVADTPDLTVWQIDRATVPLALGPLHWPDPRRRTIRHRDSGGRTRCLVFAEPSGRYWLCFDADRREAVFLTDDAAALTWWEWSYPLRPFLHWLFEPTSLQLVHAAAVGLPEAGVLLVGPSGSGKSSTALACLGSELGFVGDDFVLVETAGRPRAHSVYSSAKLERQGLARFPDIAAQFREMTDQEIQKPILFLADRQPAAVATSVPVDALLTPVVERRADTVVEPLSRAAALRIAAPSTMFQLPGGAATTFDKMARLVDRVPSFRLRLGADRAGIVGALSDLLQRLA